jgi:methylated-DNA-[protein]-cysteine S-methyltransferase
MTTVFDAVASPMGDLLLIGDGEGLTGLRMQEGPGRVEPPGTREPQAPPFEAAREQLAEYFAGRRTRFELPLAPRGTECQRRVWEALEYVRFGDTATYGELATRLGAPAAARAVGAANGRNPISIVIPCHRLVGSGGGLTGYGDGLDRKRFLLALEAGVSGRCTYTLLGPDRQPYQSRLPGTDRRSPPQPGLRSARLLRGAPLDRQRPLREPTGVLRRRGDRDRRRLSAVRELHAGALPRLEGCPARDELSRREPGEMLAVAAQVGLVRVAEFGSDPGELVVVGARRAGDEPLKPQHPVEQLRAVAHRGVEPAQELALADPERGPERGDPGAGPAEHSHRGGHHWIEIVGVAPAGEDGVGELAPMAVRGFGVGDPLGELRSGAAPDVGGRRSQVAQFGRREPQHATGGAGSQPQSDDGLSRGEMAHERAAVRSGEDQLAAPKHEVDATVWEDAGGDGPLAVRHPPLPGAVDEVAQSITGVKLRVVHRRPR